MNNDCLIYEPTKDDSTAAKGMAILAMVFLHLYCRISSLPYTPLLMIGNTPLIYYFGLFGDICVPVYCFISGYAQYLLIEKDAGKYSRKSCKRLGKLWLNFAVIAVVFSVLGLIAGSKYVPGSFLAFVLNLTLISTSYNGAWWFLLTYFFLVLLSPLFVRMIRSPGKTGCILILSASGIVYFISYLFRFVIIPDISSVLLSWLIRQVLLIGTSQFAFLVGAVFYKYRLISRLKIFLDKKHLLVPVCIAAPTALFLLHCFVQSVIIAPINGIVTIVCFYIFPHPEPVKAFFRFFGVHSTNIWLTHMFFYMAPFPDLVFRGTYPLTALVLMLSLCLITSFVIQYILLLPGKVSSLIFRREKQNEG